MTYANEAGALTPTSDDGPTVAAVAHQEKQVESTDFHCDGTAWQASLRIEGEEYARAYISRLQAGISQPDDLATLLSFLSDEMLHGACRVIEKALGRFPHG